MMSVQTNEKLVLQLYDHLPDAIVWYTPVFSDTGEVMDFTIQYFNKALVSSLGIPAEALAGSLLSESRFTDKENVVQIFAQCKKVYDTGDSVEVSYFSPLYDQFFQVTRIKVMEGVLSVIRNRTHEWKLQLEKEQQSSLVNQIIDASPTCIVLCEAVWEEKELDDFLILSVNEKIVQDLKRPKSEIEGLRYTELHPAVRTNGYLDMMKGVVLTGKPFRGEMYLEVFGGWFFISADKVEGNKILVICLNINESKTATAEIEQLNTELESIFNSSLSGICSLKAIRNSEGVIVDFIYEKANHRFESITGIPAAEVVGKRHSVIYPHARETGFFDKMCDVVVSGKPSKVELAYNFDGLNGWFECSMSAMGEDGLVTSFDDITERRNYLAEVEQKRKLLDNLLHYSPSGISILQAIRDGGGKVVDFQNVLLNDQSAVFTGLPKETLLQQSNGTIDPSFKSSAAFQILVDTLTTGEACYTDYRLEPTGKWIEGAASKMDDDHLICIVTDATEARAMQQQLQEQKNLVDNILKHSPAGITVTQVLRDDAGNIFDCRTVLANNNAERFTLIPNEVALNKRGSEIVPGLLESALFKQALQTLNTGDPFSTQYFLEPTGKWLELSVSKLDDDRLINVFTDITTSKEGQLAVERSAENLKKVIDSAQTGMFTFRPEYVDGAIVDFRFDIINSAVAAYVQEVPENMTGKLGTEFFPSYKASGVFDMYREAFETGVTLRKEVHYNVDGHDHYLDVQSTRIEDVVLVTFTDHTPIRQAHIQLERMVEELRRSNASLEEFAYAASHDLKEPIRKITFFLERLQHKYGEDADETGKQLFTKIGNSADRMRTLVEDLLAYSQVSVRPKIFDDVDLNNLLKVVINDLELEVEEKKGKIIYDVLPTIKGHPRQLQQLFVNLVGNSLKYSREGVPPLIEVRCTEVKGYETDMTILQEEKRKSFYLVEVQDNGIGFDQKDAEKIFQVFQRLHGNAEYRGTGVGLSIARKVVENHRGYMEARGEVGVGATFRILLPI